MEAKVSSSLGVTLLVTIALLAGSVAAGPQVYASFADDQPTVRINEVMPRPGAGQHDWVELHRPGASFTIFLPAVRRGAGGGVIAEAELPAPNSSDPDISGWQVGDEDGHDYTIPAALPPLPKDAFVLITFDGLGASQDDYDFSDGKAVLHAPANLADIFEDAGDQVALYSGSSHGPDTIVDFVAWGVPPEEDAADAAGAGIWQPGWYVSFESGFGDLYAEDLLAPQESLGRYPGSTGAGLQAFAVYQSSQLTPGAANPVPMPSYYTPGNGAVVETTTFSVSWSPMPGALSYRFQLDDDQQFGGPIYDVTTAAASFKPPTPLPAGSYYWRIKPLGVGGREGPWLGPIQIGIVAFPSGALGVLAERVLGIAPVSQNKDSRMLCLDGDPEGNPASNDPENAWDAPAPCTVPPCADGGVKYTHGNRYCVRASIRMMASYYGGNLTMDRISYYILQEWAGNTHGDTHDTDPNNDLGHDRGMWYPDEEDEGISWALGATITTPGGKPTFAQVKGWIDANRPIMFRDPGHMMVIDGYRDDASGQFAHILDPDQEPDFWRWQTYASQNIDGYWVGPASAPGVRSDEASVSADSDGDGIVDFDEVNRFHTDAISSDSDLDWVQDKQDMREYVFNTAGNYFYRNADQDGDGKRKERDADNDGDGAVDGCEDTNTNGKYEIALGETDNFNAASSQACVPLFEILQPTQSMPVNAGAHDNPDKILVQVRTATPPSSPVVYTAGDFEVQIGGLDSPVIAAYQVSDTHFLVVSPHTQPAANTYDLEVTLQGTQSDTETRAVYFLPKLRADQVLVIDRSGSMSDDDKMDAAKNAARAFIDHTNVGDMIGVVSFASSAGPLPDYPLTAITGDPEWNTAKAAVNGLSASGMTALGQGALLGYNQVIAGGQADHDWAMALLSDGMENVTPYWADPTVSGVIVPSRVAVHTVALGRDADRTLMAAIAGSTGGSAYEAGVDILPLEAAAAALPGPNLPTTLPNRLADVYKAIGEEIGHQQRLWEKTGTVSGHLQFEVPLEKGLPEAIFTVNWDDPGSPIQMTLYDPKGDQVKAGYPGMIHQTDTTHDQYRIRNPMAGVWVVDLRTREKMANYLFILSAWSPTTMHLAFGLPPVERTVGSEIPILVVLADTKRIKGAEVWAWVQGPNSDLVQVLQLFDDGAHHDGRSDDGVYGNLFTRTYQAGAYMVKASGWGKNNSGEEFVRHRTGGFYVLPRLAYIWREDLTTAAAYRSLLQANGFCVDLVHLDDVVETLWTRYSLAVIGPETGSGAQWGTAAAVATLQQYPVPIIGLGEGGYAFFGKVRLAIGYPYGWHGSENRTYVMDTAHQVWHSPYPIPVPRDRVVTLYKRTSHVGIEILKPPADVTLIGREPADQTHYNLVQQTERYLLWGFQAEPSAMSGDGQCLFVNVARYMAGM